MAIPLVVAVLVCLLATSGVWLLTADKDDADGRDSTPIGLNVPTAGPVPGGTDTTGPSGGKAMPPDKSQPPSASPTASATPTPSKSSTKPRSSAPPSPPPPSSAPPPPSSAPPQPKPYAVAGSASREQSGRTVVLTITVQNPNASPLGAWWIEIDGRDLWRATVESAPASVQFSDDRTRADSGGTLGSTTVTLRLKLYYWSFQDNVSYTFVGARTTVPVNRS